MENKYLELTQDMISIIYQMGDIALKQGGNNTLEGINRLYTAVANAKTIEEINADTN
jgi:hypothetical protein